MGPEEAERHEPGTLNPDMEKPAPTPAAILMTAMLIPGCSTPTDDVTGATITQGPINFGTNDSAWANDGECDDPRFEGPGTDDLTQTDDRGADASDCLSLYNAGEVGWRGSIPTRAPSTSATTRASTHATGSATTRASPDRARHGTGSC